MSMWMNLFIPIALAYSSIIFSQLLIYCIFVANVEAKPLVVFIFMESELWFKQPWTVLMCLIYEWHQDLNKTFEV